jgi:hypothetical protein
VAMIPIDNQIQIVQIRALWSLYSSGGGESSWSFIMPAAAPPAQQIVLDAWRAYLMDPFRTGRPGAWELTEVWAEDRWPGIRARLVSEEGLGQLGDAEGEALPAQVTPVISWRTGEIGRSNRGRTYMGPYTIDSVGPDNNITNPANNACSDFAEAMINNFTGTHHPSGPRFAIVSRQHDGVPGNPGTYTLPVEYVFLGRWAVMRRRFRYSWAS